MFLKLIFLKLHIIPVILINLVLLASTVFTNSDDGVCSNKLVMGIDEFEIYVYNFQVINTNVVEGYRVQIYVEPGKYLSKLEEYPLKNNSHYESIFSMFISKYSNSYYQFRISSSYINSSIVIEGYMNLNSTKVVFYNYSYVYETKQYSDYLTKNLTIQIAIMKSNATVNYFKTGGARGKWYINLSLNNIVLSYDELFSNRDLDILFPFSPLLRDPYYSNILIRGVLEKLLYNYTVDTGYRRVLIELHGSMIDIQVRNDIYTLEVSPNLLINLSKASYVKINNVNVSAISLENGVLNISFKMNAQGLGSRREIIVRNVLDNTVYISKIYGCFKLETIGFKIMVNNTPLTYVYPDLDVDKVVIEETIGFGTRELFKINTVLIVLIVAISLSISVLLILSKHSGFRLLRLKHT